jgi:hypothetical protein
MLQDMPQLGATEIQSSQEYQRCGCGRAHARGAQRHASSQPRAARRAVVPRLRCAPTALSRSLPPARRGLSSPSPPLPGQRAAA